MHSISTFIMLSIVIIRSLEYNQRIYIHIYTISELVVDTVMLRNIKLKNNQKENTNIRYTQIFI